MSQHFSLQLRHQYPGIHFLVPTLVLLAGLAVIPFVAVIIVSFTAFSPGSSLGEISWVGGANYRRLLSDAELSGSLLRTLLFASVAVGFQLLLGTAVGEYLFRIGHKRYLWLSLVALPMLVAPVVAGLVWRLLFQGEFGAVSLVFKALGFFRATSITSSPATALAAVCIVDIWQWTPFVTFLYLAARSVITSSQVEAARVDGASELRIWAGVIFPLLVPTLLACGLLRFLEAIREFDKVYILTSGGPGSATELLSIYIWRVAFRSWDFGYAAALCVLFYLLVLLLTSVTLWALRGTLQPLFYTDA